MFYLAFVEVTTLYMYRWVGGVRRLSMAEASGWAQHAKLICKRLQQAGDELAAVTPALSALMRNTEACAS